MTRGLMQSDLFDVSEVQKINDDIKAEDFQKRNIEARKTLVLPRFDEPKNDNELLLNFQFDFLKNGDKDAWGKLITLAYKVTERLIWRRIKQNKLKLDELEQEERVDIAVYYVLRRYTTRIGYAVTTNYITALDCGVTHALNYTTKLQQETDYIEDVVTRNEIKDTNYGV